MDNVKKTSAFNLVMKHFVASFREMFSQFDTNESMISNETQELLNDSENRKQIYDELLKEPKSGKSTIKFKDGKEITFFVEA